MNTQYFPHFIRANYPVLKNETNELLIELGDEFKKYLEEKYSNDMNKLEHIWDIEPKTVVMSQVKKDPFTMNGYHPALLIHFSDFIEKMKKEALNEIDMHNYNIGDVVSKKSGKPFKSGKKEEIITNFAINETDPKKRDCVVFEDGSQCNIDMLNPKP